MQKHTTKYWGRGARRRNPIKDQSVDEALQRCEKSGTVKRYDLINMLIMANNYKSYLEVGVHQAYCYDRVVCDNKLGLEIDPEFYSQLQHDHRTPARANGDPNLVRPGIINIGSDEYFEGISSDKKFDIIFIDASHYAEDVDKDIANALRCLSDGGVLVMHDCNPPHYLCTVDTEAQTVKVNIGAGRVRGFPVKNKILDLSTAPEEMKSLLRHINPEKLSTAICDKKTGEVLESYDNSEFSVGVHEWIWKGFPYNGTAWKSFVKLRYENPEFGMWVLDDDHGVGVIKPSAKSTTSLPKDISLDQALDWDTFDKNRLTLLNLVNPNEIRGHLI